MFAIALKKQELKELEKAPQQSLSLPKKRKVLTEVQESKMLKVEEKKNKSAKKQMNEQKKNTLFNYIKNKGMILFIPKEPPPKIYKSCQLPPPSFLKNRHEGGGQLAQIGMMVPL